MPSIYDKPHAPNWSWDKLKYYITFKEQGYYEEYPKLGPGFKDTSKKHLPLGSRLADTATIKVTDIPQLAQVEKRLETLGLKNNWLRNEVWRYDARKWGTPADRWLVIFRYFKYGFAPFVVYEVLTRTIFKSPDAGHGHGHGHGEHHEEKYKLLYELEGNH